MKKFFIAAGVIILLTISVFSAVMLINGNSPAEKPTSVANNETESRTVYTQKPSTDINVDSWLKISEITEYKGRLAVVAENISADDEFEKLQELIIDPNKKQELIQKHLEIKERIVEFLNTQKRGNK